LTNNSQGPVSKAVNFNIGVFPINSSNDLLIEFIFFSRGELLPDAFSPNHLAQTCYQHKSEQKPYLHIPF